MGTALATLRTSRLELRPIEEGELEALACLVADPAVAAYIGDGHPRDRTAAAAMISNSARSFAEGLLGLFCMLALEGGEFVGYCGIETGEDTGEPELDYALSPAYWGRGLALEAAGAVLSLADSLYEVLAATADPRNVASLRILDRLGFVHIRSGPDVHGLPTEFFRRNSPIRSTDAR